METPTNTPVLIEIEDDNQVLAFFLNTFHSALKMIVNLAILSTNIVLSPFVLTYMFWEYTIRKSWQITKHIVYKIYELLEIIPLAIQVWFWSVACSVMFLLFIKRMGEISVIVEKKIYKRLKRILHILNALPFTHKHAASLNAILKKVPIFSENFLPYPYFLFEDTFTNINYRNGTVSMTLPIPSDPSNQSGTETKPSDSSTTALSDQTPASKTTPVINEPKPETGPAANSSNDQNPPKFEETSSSSL